MPVAWNTIRQKHYQQELSLKNTLFHKYNSVVAGSCAKLQGLHNGIKTKQVLGRVCGNLTFLEMQTLATAEGLLGLGQLASSRLPQCVEHEAVFSQKHTLQQLLPRYCGMGN